MNRRRLCLRLFARAQRSSAEGPPPGFRQILTVPLLRHFSPFQVPFLRGENPRELNRRRLCLRLFARAQRRPASSSHAFAHDAFRLSPKRVLPRRLLLFPKNLCVCKSFSGALLSRRETADTYRPPSSSFLPFQVPFLRGGGPKELDRRRLCLRLFARAQRSSAEGPPPGFRQILTVPILLSFLPFQVPFLRGGKPK